jgi:hypothetical protein
LSRQDASRAKKLIALGFFLLFLSFSIALQQSYAQAHCAEERCLDPALVLLALSFTNCGGHHLVLLSNSLYKHKNRGKFKKEVSHLTYEIENNPVGHSPVGSGATSPIHPTTHKPRSSYGEG